MLRIRSKLKVNKYEYVCALNSREKVTLFYDLIIIYVCGGKVQCNNVLVFERSVHEKILRNSKTEKRLKMYL